MKTEKNEDRKTYMCIDMKSFFASVECVQRGLDPFKTNLVVADPDRGDGTICLAVSPAMKALGVPGRCRVFEIPKNIEYIKAKPRMSLYLEKSAQIYSIYLQYFSPDDIHVYSIDESFIDISGYRLLYRKSDREIAEMLRNAVFEQTGITATVGIGSNLFLAKVALDIISKNAPDYIGILDDRSFKEKISHHRPITDIWNIGKGTAKRLEKFGVFDLDGVANMPEDVLYRTFGVNARYLIDHSNGKESCTISDIKNYVPKSSSLSNSQVLFRDYSYDEAWLIMHEMVENMVLNMVKKGCIVSLFSLCISYSGHIVKPFSVSEKISFPTSSYKKITEIFDSFYRRNPRRELPIKQITISMGGLENESNKPITLFDDIEYESKEHSLMKTFIDIHERFGKNALIRGRDLCAHATLQERNKLIGGHRG